MKSSVKLLIISIIILVVTGDESKILSKGNNHIININENYSEELIPSKYDCLSNAWSETDKYAASVPDKFKSSIQVLVKYLCKNAKNDIEKSRVIFTWIALNISYDDNSFNTGHYRDFSPEAVFKTKFLH